MLEITRVDETAFDEIWPIFQAIVKSGDTFVYAPDISKQDAKLVWFDPKFQTYIAYEVEDEKDEGRMMNDEVSTHSSFINHPSSFKKIVGAYVIRPNHRDLGNHIANAAYIVCPNARKTGVGRKMAEHSFVEAKKASYEAMQFNFVVSTNQIAVNLWQSVGFIIVGTVPDGYRHQQLGRQVDIFIMYRKL